MQFLKRFYLPIVAFSLLLSACDSNSEDSGVITTTDVLVGTGELVQKESTYIVGWEGRLPNGSIFDSSQLQGEDLMFVLGVGKVIAGLDEGILGMRIGGKRTIEIPASKAFGQQGSCVDNGSCQVPGNTTVTYDVEIKSRMSTVTIQEIVEGAGNIAEVDDLLQVQYVGALLSGTVFDASEQHGLNAVLQFRLGHNEVIDGLDIGIAGMRPGGSRLITIPPELGYKGVANGGVPAWSVMIFRIDLVKIVDES